MHSRLLSWSASLAAVLLGGCAGNGEGLDAQGQPIGSGTNPTEPLTADFQSIQDNVFTPICVRCHSGGAAPEGLQLDAAHSYTLLVGVPSTEVPSIQRVNPGDPDSSYIVLKLEDAPASSARQMPFGGPYLPQATINVIRQWITNGAPPASGASAGGSALRSRPPRRRIERAHASGPSRRSSWPSTTRLILSLLNETHAWFSSG